ncbi:MAG: NADH-quinone oxidoreductase subunit A [Elusimicrobia bacterium]|nr:NADH-quinone oxidoreductase subunit A [Elusimicrobiota bacterium]
MKYLIVQPPVAFLIILISTILASFISSFLSFKSKTKSEGKCKPYACGEDIQKSRVQPDYSQFFPFAFFFTIMHVLALILTTVPLVAIKYSGNVFLYVLAAVCGLLILFRKEKVED